MEYCHKFASETEIGKLIKLLENDPAIAAPVESEFIDPFEMKRTQKGNNTSKGFHPFNIPSMYPPSSSFKCGGWSAFAGGEFNNTLKKTNPTEHDWISGVEISIVSNSTKSQCQGCAYKDEKNAQKRASRRSYAKNGL